MNNPENIDTEKQLANQLDTIKRVINWLREEALEPHEITHLRKDSRYYGVIISNEGEKVEQNERQRRKAIHILFPIERPDSLNISEIIIFDLQTQKAYSSLATKTKGILEQSKFYSELKLALHQMNVDFLIKKGERDLQSLEVSKVLFFDGLTKNTLFTSINEVHNSIEIARIKTGIFRDSILSSEAAMADEYHEK